MRIRLFDVLFSLRNVFVVFVGRAPVRDDGVGGGYRAPPVSLGVAVLAFPPVFFFFGRTRFPRVDHYRVNVNTIVRSREMRRRSVDSTLQVI